MAHASTTGISREWDFDGHAELGVVELLDL